MCTPERASVDDHVNENFNSLADVIPQSRRVAPFVAPIGLARNVNHKVKHWRAFQGIFALLGAPDNDFSHRPRDQTLPEFVAFSRQLEQHWNNASVLP